MQYFDLLRQKCSLIFGKTPQTTSDFERLSDAIVQSCGLMISTSTLKRLWGYVDNPNKARRSTLDVLSAYCGFSSYERFCEHHSQSAVASTSDFYSANSIGAEEITASTRVEIGWSPDRRLLLRAEAQREWFEVKEAENSKIIVGDRVQCAQFAHGQPLVFRSVIRAGRCLASYVAAKEYGLSTLNILDK